VLFMAFISVFCVLLCGSYCAFVVFCGVFGVFCACVWCVFGSCSLRECFFLLGFVWLCVVGIVSVLSLFVECGVCYVRCACYVCVVCVVYFVCVCALCGMWGFCLTVVFVCV